MGPALRVISPEATPEEVAAIVAAIEALARVAPVSEHPLDHQDWVQGARMAARRVPLQRGSWRLSGRIAGRSRS